MIGGAIVARLLQGHDWRAVFYFGSAITAAFIPLVLFLVPESVHWLTRKQPAGALETINRILKRLGHASVSALPAISAEVRRRSVADIFAPGLVALTVLVTAAYFFHVITFYFIIKWVPKIVVDMGFAPSSAAECWSGRMLGRDGRRRARIAGTAIQCQESHACRDAAFHGGGSDVSAGRRRTCSSWR